MNAINPINATNAINAIQEKPDGGAGWVNGGFFVLSPKVIDRIEGDRTIWERDPLESLACDGVKSYEGYPMKVLTTGITGFSGSLLRSTSAATGSACSIGVLMRRPN